MNKDDIVERADLIAIRRRGAFHAISGERTVSEVLDAAIELHNESMDKISLELAGLRQQVEETLGV